MSFTYGFYNSLNGDRKYDAIQFGQLFDGIINDGVFMSIGGKLMVTAGTGENAGMKVNVATGRAWFDSTWSYNDSIMVLDIPAAEVLLKRIDAVILEVNATENVRTNSIKVVKGTPASSPVAPTLSNSGKIYQHPLAYIAVAAGATAITQANITNKVGTSDCPFVTGILETMDIDDLIAQWGTEWDEFMSETETTTNGLITNWTNEWTTWKNQQVSEYETWSDQQKSDFDDWFADVKNTLSGDVAGNLKNQIDACAKTVTFNATVSTSWTIKGSYAQQTIAVNGILATDNPIVDLITTTSNFRAEQENWGQVFKITTAANAITLYATGATTIPLNIQIKVVR